MPHNRTRSGLTYACEVCGVLSYAAPFRAASARFCGFACRSAAKIAQRPARICTECGATFYPSPASPVLRCGRACADRAKRRTLAERFNPKVVRGNACWLWGSALDRRGYGRFAVEAGRYLAAHRVAWELASGLAIPDGHVIAHACDTPACVRNDDNGTYTVNGVAYPRWGHLFCAPQSVNLADMAAKGRASHGEHHAVVVAPHIRFGEASNFAKTPEHIIRAILSRYTGRRGEQAALAREYGLSHQHVHRIVARKRWKHLD